MGKECFFYLCEVCGYFLMVLSIAINSIGISGAIRNDISNIILLLIDQC